MEVELLDCDDRLDAVEVLELLTLLAVLVLDELREDAVLVELLERLLAELEDELSSPVDHTIAEMWVQRCTCANVPATMPHSMPSTPPDVHAPPPFGSVSSIFA